MAGDATPEGMQRLLNFYCWSAGAVPGGGRTLIDRELYLPQAWTDDRDRCRRAGIADEVAFATKPELARQMIERAIAARMPFGWVAADEVCGQHTPLRDWLGQQCVGYVLPVPKSFPVVTAAGKMRAHVLAARVPAAGWQQVSCGAGAKGPRCHDWALIATTSPAHHLLVRRPLTPMPRASGSWRSSPATHRRAPPWPS